MSGMSEHTADVIALWNELTEQDDIQGLLDLIRDEPTALGYTPQQAHEATAHLKTRQRSLESLIAQAVN